MTPHCIKRNNVAALAMLVLSALPAAVIGNNATSSTSLPSPPAHVATYSLQQVGSGEFRFGIFGRIYSATLYAPPGLSANELLLASVPKQLELRYHASVSISQIANAAERKIRQQRGDAALVSLKPVLDAWHGAMRDVRDGDSYLMSYADGELEMRLNGEVLTRLQAPALAAAYFGIWLDDKPISESLRDALLDGLTTGQELARDHRG